jgi:hypothetical protein
MPRSPLPTKSDHVCSKLRADVVGDASAALAKKSGLRRPTPLRRLPNSSVRNFSCSLRTLAFA